MERRLRNSGLGRAAVAYNALGNHLYMVAKFDEARTWLERGRQSSIEARDTEAHIGARQLRQHVVVVIKVAGDTHDAKRDLESHATVQDVEIRGDTLYVTLHDSITEFSDLATDLVQAGHKLKMFREDELDLESAFMALTKGMHGDEESDDTSRFGERGP